MKTMTRLALSTALLLSGCSLVIDSGQYTGGEDGGVADTGTGDSAVDTGPRDGGRDTGPRDGGRDTGPRDGGRDTGPSPDGGDAGPSCLGCPAGLVMFDTGHCIEPAPCTVSCRSTDVCDPFYGNGCWPRLACNAGALPPGLVCGDFGPVRECECPAGESTMIGDPLNPDATCRPCTAAEHYASDFGACVPGTEACSSDASCTPPETCAERFPLDGMYCADDGAGPICPSPTQTDCGTPIGCVDLQTDPLNCGSCGIDCGSGTCDAGACTGTSCVGARTECFGTCVDLASDTMNCGGCGRGCAAAETCVSGACVTPTASFCDCAGGEICLGGTCARSGACDSVYIAPDCSGRPSGTTSEVPAFRVASRSFSGSLQRLDLHITGNVSGTPTAQTPGWTMLWRTEAGVLQAAFASPEYDPTTLGGCYYGGTLGRVRVCGTAPTPAFGQMDARTIYAGTAAAVGGPLQPQTVMTTASEPTSTTAIDLWNFTSFPTSDAHPTRLCITSAQTWRDLNAAGTALPPVTDLSLSAYGPGVGIFATLGTNTMASFGQGVMVPSTRPAPVNVGAVAGGYAAGLYAGLSGNQVIAWDTGVMAISHNLASGIATDPVAAIDPQQSTSTEVFALGRADGSLQTLVCSFGSGSCTSTGVFSVPTVPGTPIAAYRSGSLVTLLALENGGGASQLVRRTSMSDLQVILTDATVGGTITGLLAIDAERVMDMNPVSRTQEGWDQVWAAMIVVDRAGVESLELWTGAERQCI
ncbi:MAG: hypothetical protein GXP55_01165 [Deltaproteobacteria bacterium]|nr:hypothetical protein [Deltaproteobacteria bacterium]